MQLNPSAKAGSAPLGVEVEGLQGDVAGAHARLPWRGRVPPRRCELVDRQRTDRVREGAQVVQPDDLRGKNLLHFFGLRRPRAEQSKRAK